MGEDNQHEQQSIRDGRHDEEIGGHDLIDLIGEEGPLRLGGRTPVARDVLSHRRWLTSMPSFKSSPWILGAPHTGFASAIVRINTRTSGGTAGLPRRRRLFHCLSVLFSSSGASCRAARPERRTGVSMRAPDGKESGTRTRSGWCRMATDQRAIKPEMSAESLPARVAPE